MNVWMAVNAVFDLVRHARRKQSEAGEPVEPPHVCSGTEREFHGNGIFRIAGFLFGRRLT